ncbi:MAG: hypothetical protein QOF62_1554 [Pyrinomonadaceae bacterium]|jgi:hypothetical protein|nr:hypothetical protein [Pyrinomonadaceae bacterium]
MANSGGPKLMFKLASLGILGACLWIFTSGGLTQSANLTIEHQPDSPLQISSSQIDLTYSEPSLEVTLMLASRSVKPIRAFTIASSVGRDKTGALLITTNTDEQMWQFNEIKPITMRKSRAEIIDGVKLSIDFVEFSDGTTWGPDSFNSADDLAGEREGLRLSVQILSQIAKTKGFGGFINNLTSNRSDISIPKGKSLSWERGFQRGAGTVIERLNRAYTKGGPGQLESEWARTLADSKRTSPE